MNIGKIFSQNFSQQQLSLLRYLEIPFKRLLAAIDFLYPKNDKLMIFGSFNGTYVSGCPKALYEYVRDSHPEYNPVYYSPFKNDNRWQMLSEMVRFFPTFFSARYIVSSHPPTDFIPYTWWSNRKIFINTFHGTPLKGIVFADSLETDENLRRIPKLNDKTSYYLVSSKLEATLISYCFLLNPRKFCSLGHPRNDVLLKNDHVPILRSLVDGDVTYDKVVLYCPTFRHGKSVELFPFQDFDKERLNQFLRDNKMLLLMRTHAFSLDDEKLSGNTNLIHFGYDTCEDIYEILPEIDCIITDYSSIFIDYLLVDKPMIFVPYDLEEFKETRGLVFDDYDFWTPGYKVASFADFLQAMSEVVIGADPFQESRRKICSLFHYNQTANSCEHIFNYITKQEHQLDN